MFIANPEPAARPAMARMAYTWITMKIMVEYGWAAFRLWKRIGNGCLRGRIKLLERSSPSVFRDGSLGTPRSIGIRIIDKHVPESLVPLL